MKTIDARGLSCPEPVLLTRNAMGEKGSAYQILVDNVTACENVKRYAGSQGYQVAVGERDGAFTLSVTK